MSIKLSKRSLVLGFHPTSRGFGWVVFENPFMLVAHGVYDAKGGRKNDKCLRKIVWVLRLYEPEVLVIEAFDKESSMRSDRIRKLCLAVVSAASERQAEVDCLKRADVHRAFAAIGAKTRDDIAEAVARHLPELRPRLPKRRKRWDAEDKRLSIFSAAALVLAHYHNGAAAFLDELRNAA